MPSGIGPEAKLGQKTMAGSIPVTIASDQTATGTKVALTGAAPTFVTVGNTSASAVASNAARKGLVLINTSNNTISLGLNGNAAVLNSGITLMANGGVWEMDEYTFTTGQIFAIASAGSSNMSVQEFS